MKNPKYQEPAHERDGGGIRMEIIPGTDEAVAVDALVDDFLHGKTGNALKDLHEPASE